MGTGYIAFADYLNEKLQDPAFVEGFAKENTKLEIEIKMNELLQNSGNNDFFVEVKDMSDLDDF